MGLAAAVVGVQPEDGRHLMGAAAQAQAEVAKKVLEAAGKKPEAAQVKAAQAGYTEVAVPYLVNRTAMTGTGQLPKLEGKRMTMFMAPKQLKKK